MGEDTGFNITLGLGCLVGAVAGYRVGGIISSVDGCLPGFAASAVCAATLAEVSDAVGTASKAGAWLIARTSPLLTLVVLVALAHGYWK